MSGSSPDALTESAPARRKNAGPVDRDVAPGSGEGGKQAPQAAAPPRAAKLSVRDLRKTFGNLVALDSPSLEVHEGEFLTLLGPSGSGKTTLLMAIAGLGEPDSGEVRIEGALATYLPTHRRDIGMVFQNYALFPHMTIHDNIAFPLRMRRLPAQRIREAVARVLNVIRLPDIAERYPRQLSGGQQQRVALARALVYEPSIVLMDEPLGALDRKLREQLQLEVKRLHKELGFAVLYVTHDQEEALVMSDRICLMRDGRIEQIGTPDELYFRPCSLFAADFLGESNLIPGRLLDVSGGVGRVAIGDGLEATGILAGDAEIGAEVRLMIRPEALRIESGPCGENSLPARFTEAVMTGSTTKCFFRGPADRPLVAHVLTGRDAEDLRPGKEARLAWDRQACVVLRDE